MELENLIRSCIAGKRDAQKQFFIQFFGSVNKICKRYCKDTDEAKDLAQESMIKIFEQIHSLNNFQSIHGWVKRVTVNHCLNHIRKQKVQFQSIDDPEEFIDIEDESIEEVSEKIDSELVLKQIQLLPLGYRTVLNLFVFENYSHQEIAQTLGITEGTSKSQLNKARKYLKELLITNQIHQKIL